MEEALYVLGKNILGKNVTDRLFPVAKTLAKGMGHIGDGLSTFGELLPAPVEFGDSALTLLPSSLVVDEDEYNRQVHSYITYLNRLGNFSDPPTKGQLISKRPFAVIVWTKIPTKFFPGFLP